MSAARFIDAAIALAPQIRAAAEEGERQRRLPLSVVRAIAQAGLFRLWVPRSLGGEETDAITLIRIVEEIARADGATGWCVAIGGELGVFGGYLPADAARQIYGSNPNVVTAGAFRPFGEAVIVDGGYRVSGRWPLGSGCQHADWIVGGCRIVDGGQPQLGDGGMPKTRILFFPPEHVAILDTWHSIGLRGTGSHDFTVTDLFVPAAHSLSFREPPIEPGPLYSLPTIALFGAALAAVSIGIARHAIDILTELSATKIASRSRQALREDATMQAALGRAEALLRSGRAFLHEVLGEAWQTACTGRGLTIPQRAMLWLASSHAAIAAKEACELAFNAGGSASPYVNSGLERCVRDIHASAQHVTVVPANYQMAGQAFLGADMSASLLMLMDDRGDSTSAPQIAQAS